MNVLKEIAVALLSFLLFLCLSLFGIAFTLKSTALNPDFVTSEINRLDVSTLLKDLIIIEPTPEQIWAADCDGNGQINIMDVLGIVNDILGTGECHP